MKNIPNRPYWIAIQAGVTPVAFGPPGVGKTAVFMAFCKATGRQPYVLVPSSRDTTDYYGCPFQGTIEITNGHKRTVSVMEIASPAWAAKFWDGQKWALFLDELTTALPIIQAANLRIIAERHVGEMPLPKDTWIAAAANPPETAPNGVDLCPPLANRLCHLKWEQMTDEVLTGFASGLRFPEPEFDVLPADWEKYLPGAGGMAAAFHRHLPGRLNKEPSDPAGQSGPWPSQRTWEYAIKCMAAVESVDAGDSVSLTLLAGLVGQAVASEFFQWKENLDLPDPEKTLAEAMSAIEAGRDMDYHHPNRCDKVIAMLTSITQRVALDKTPKRWEAAMHVMERAASHEIDVAMACARPLADLMPKGARVSAEFVGRMFPKIRVALGL